MKNKIFSNIVLILIGLSLISYTFYKAINSSFTHDESFTYNNYVNIPVSDIINYTNCPDIPNNHIFNTLLMKCAQELFGNGEFALRLPNLLAHILYVIFSVVWLKKFKSKSLLISGFIILNINVYLLDFFSMARGYGLSISFMFISIYYCYEYFKTLTSKFNWLSFFFAALAVWSNFTVLNYYVALISVFFILLISRTLLEDKQGVQKAKLFIYESLPLICISFILYRLISNPLATIRGNLFGPEAGFYHNTVRSLVYSSVRFKNGYLIDIPCYFVILVFIISILYYSYDLVKRSWNVVQSSHLLVLLILFFSAFSTVLQHYFFKTQFLENRTGLFYIVLFNISFVNLYDLLKKTKSARRMHIIFTVYPVLLTLVFIFNFNPNYYFDWIYDANTKEMITDLKSDIKNTPDIKTKISLGITWLFEPTINYYRVTRHLDWLNPVNRDGYEGDFDYYYLWNDKDYVKKKNLIIIKEFDNAESVLAKKLTQGQ